MKKKGGTLNEAHIPKTGRMNNRGKVFEYADNLKRKVV